MSVLYLIRHGKTEANEQHLYCGSTDLPLSADGIAELKKLHYVVPEVRFVTSGMKRTEQTLHVLFGDVPHTAEPELREVDFGIFEMKSYEMLKDDPAYQAWITGDNEKNTPPHGESGERMKRRVRIAADRLLSFDEDIAAVTHGGVISCIMEYLFPEEHKNRYQWQPEPGHGYAVENGTYRPIP